MIGRYYSAALSSALDAELTAHLLRKDGQEDLCFAIWYPSEGMHRTTVLLYRAVLPAAVERRVHGNASFMPAYFERAIGEAMATGGGLAFLHSHVGPGWQGMSGDDVRAEESHAASAYGATGLPLVGLTLGTDGAWSARAWERTGPRHYDRRWCESVRVVGEQLCVTYHDGLRPAPSPREELRRTILAWGPDAQAQLARLRIGIVGAGSVGCIVGEALARTGIENVTLIDFDTVERVNLDRLLHATIADIGRAKVRVLGVALRQGATAEPFIVDEVEFGVGEEMGYRAALDCDILFSCVDRPWPRSILNAVAYAHLIPVIDGGIDVTTTKRGTLRGADWRAHIAGPDHRCLECIGQYNPGLVSADREGYFDDPTYIRGVESADGVRGNENVFGFSLAVASLEVLQLLAMVIAPAGVANLGGRLFHFVEGTFELPTFDLCKPTCLYPQILARGDSGGIVLTGRHRAAELKRAERAMPRPGRVSPLRHLLKVVMSVVRGFARSDSTGS
jgi:molybdopterin/thiamine biosynthesis adenylyltransferase